MIRFGKTPSKKVVISEIVRADAKRSRILNVTGNDSLYRLGRITMADGEPLNYTLTYLPQKLFPELRNMIFKQILYTN